MIGFAKNELHVLVLRDRDRVADVLDHALATASAEERPGLERAAALIAEATDYSDDEMRGRWVRQQLAAAGVEGPSDSVRAIKALRQAAPGLSLANAVQLAKAAAATE